MWWLGNGKVERKLVMLFAKGQGISHPLLIFKVIIPCTDFEFHFFGLHLLK